MIDCIASAVDDKGGSGDDYACANSGNSAPPPFCDVPTVFPPSWLITEQCKGGGGDAQCIAWICSTIPSITMTAGNVTLKQYNDALPNSCGLTRPTTMTPTTTTTTPPLVPPGDQPNLLLAIVIGVGVAVIAIVAITLLICIVIRRRKADVFLVFWFV